MLSTKNKLSRYVLLFSTLVFSLFALHSRPAPHYAHLSLINPDQVQIDYLWQADINKTICQEKLNLLDEVVMANCPNCKLVEQNCLAKLSDLQKQSLSSDWLDLPSIRLSNGTITYQSSSPQLALQACQNAQALQLDYNHQPACTPNQTLRFIHSLNTQHYWATLVESALLLLICSLASWFICYLILRYEHLHQHFSHDSNYGIQKFHAQATPRIGGIALFASLLILLAVEIIHQPITMPNSVAMTFFILSASPVFLGGLIEDVTKNVGVAHRLLFSMLSALIAITLLGAVIDRTEISQLDNVLIWTPVAVAFTVFGIAGVCNAINIIDGYNGLSAGYASLALAALSCVAFQVNDHLVFTLSLGLLGGLLGFLCWNWPHGKLFMGDGGAYLLGFSLAELAIMLIYRNPTVSPWFTAIILAYPIFETLFSMVRRKFINKTKTGQPDAGHLHQLVFLKILHGHHYSDAHQTTHANSRVAFYILGPALLVSLVATVFWQSTAILLPLTLIGCGVYVLVYYKLLSMPD